MKTKNKKQTQRAAFNPADSESVSLTGARASMLLRNPWVMPSQLDHPSPSQTMAAPRTERLRSRDSCISGLET